MVEHVCTDVCFKSQHTGSTLRRLGGDDFDVWDCCYLRSELRKYAPLNYASCKHTQTHINTQPENIVLKDPSAQRLTIIDLGMAQDLSTNRNVKVMAGTPEFVGTSSLITSYRIAYHSECTLANTPLK